MCKMSNSCINVENEFYEIDAKRAWPLLYQHIRNACTNYDYTVLEARKVQNKNLNRYRDVNPYDHSRVVLSRGACDYINANLVTMEKTHRRYILTQGPLPQTTGHFWLMVWEQNCKAILMLNRVIEKNQVKCHQYWPMGGETGINEMVLDDVGLRVEYVSETEASYYTTRVLRLTELESGNSREILHFHYTTWPDFGVPQSPTAFLNFLMVVRKSGVLDQNVGPPVVHCSAGIGRSGTFCLVDSCLVLMEENGVNSVNVRDVLLEMRKYRMGLIQTPDQLRFSYLAIIEGAKKYIMKNNVNNIYDDIIELNAIQNNSVENKNDSDSEDPPPLPPPRGESLTRSMNIESLTCIVNNHAVEGENVSPPDKPLPVEPPRDHLSNGPPDQPLPCEPDDSSDEECNAEQPDERHLSPSSDNVRKRIRRERQESLAQKVQEMKRKQQEAERWQATKRSILSPWNIGIGIGVLIFGGGVLAYAYYSSKV